jgi:hypothetical protein
MKSVFEDNILDEKDIEVLDSLEREITDIHSRGKINEVQYSNLKNEISISYDKIFRKNVDFLKNLSNKTDSTEQLNKLKENIEMAHSE